MRYQDFIVQIGADHGDGHLVQVLQSPAGEGEGRLSLDAVMADTSEDAGQDSLAVAHQDGGEIAAAATPRAVEAAPVPRATAPTPRALGLALFRALFHGRVRNLYDESVGVVRTRGDDWGLRLKLRLNPHHPELGSVYELPWELLCHPERGKFLGLSRRWPIVRYLEVPRPMTRAPLPSPLRVLATLASPQGLEPLDLARERRTIERALGRHPNVEVHFLENTTTRHLRQALLGSSFHVLHFMGHGALDPATGDAQLLFQAADGTPDPVGGQALDIELGGARGLRLVFLNACDSARGGPGGVRAFASVATALVRAGLPAVVAMQQPISDRAALVLSETFYDRLAQGDPVDTALSEARIAIFADQRHAREWSTPVLFMRTPDGKLFERAPASTPPTAGPARSDEQIAPTAGAGWQLLVTVERAGTLVARYPVSRSPLSIGSSPDCDIVLSDPYASWHHADVTVARGQVTYRDRSSNGSFVDGVRVRERRLTSRDAVVVPPFTLRFELRVDARRPSTLRRSREVVFEGDMPTQPIIALPEPRRPIVERVAERTPAGGRPSPAGPETGAISGPTALMTQAPIEPSPPPCRLRVLVGPRGWQGRTFALEGAWIEIGRGDEAGVRLDLTTISRGHARLIREQDGGWRLSDLASANGTYVNGRKVTSARLSLGDRIRFGDLETVLELASKAPGPKDEER